MDAETHKGNDIVPLRKCQEILLEFGLTPSQAKVYLAAVRLGIAPVSKVSQACDVRREDTYRALSKLEEIGLVEKVTDKPTQVRALPAEEALTILMKSWQESVREKELSLTLKKQDFLKHFKAAKKLQLPKEERHFALLLERDAVFARVMEMLKTTEKEIDAVTSSKEIPQMLPAFGETLRKQSSKAIKVRLILETPENGKALLTSMEKHLPASLRVELKYAFKPLSHYIIADFKNVLLATSREPPIGRLPYLWTDTPDFVKLLERHFDELWRISRSLQATDTTA
jgi:sugar-specific transcriptional regulator TrmB